MNVHHCTTIKQSENECPAREKFAAIVVKRCTTTCKQSGPRHEQSVALDDAGVAPPVKRVVENEHSTEIGA